MSSYISTSQLMTNGVSASNGAGAIAARPAKPVRAVKRKTRITIYLDDEVLAEFRTLAEQCGKGYQTLINAALRTGLAPAGQNAALAE